MLNLITFWLERRQEGSSPVCEALRFGWGCDYCDCSCYGAITMSHPTSKLRTKSYFVGFTLKIKYVCDRFLPTVHELLCLFNDDNWIFVETDFHWNNLYSANKYILKALLIRIVMFVRFSLVKCSFFVFTYGTKSSSIFISTIKLFSSYLSLAINLKASSFLNLNSISLLDLSSRSLSSRTVLTSFRSFDNSNVFTTVLWQVKVLLNFKFRRLYLSRCHFTYSLYLFMIFI